MQFTILVLLLIIIAFIIYIVLKQYVTKALNNPKRLEELMSAVDELIDERINLIEGELARLDNVTEKAQKMLRLLEKEASHLQNSSYQKPIRSIKADSDSYVNRPINQASHLKASLHESEEESQNYLANKEDLVYISLSSHDKAKGANNLNVVEDISEKQAPEQGLLKEIQPTHHSNHRPSHAGISQATDVDSEIIALYREGKDEDEISSLLGIPQARTSLIIQIFLAKKK